MACTVQFKAESLDLNFFIERLMLNTGIKIDVKQFTEKGEYCYSLNPIGKFTFGLDSVLIKSRNSEYKLISTREGYLFNEAINIINELLSLKIPLPKGYKSTKYKELSFFDKIKFR
ncbi:hypothetical protein [Aureispira sp. CCB-E]|uniref:hypothetical protein n=1 Tax=Aureispira sp. CCB-E TaxID=3051121 RepID=UPI002868DC19|nr:hypothetical protein [Aureispira sp. CCB-E]WMX17594.1 hypothetical protein QP953_28335 [Aureispira sp. CCB-E]